MPTNDKKPKIKSKKYESKLEIKQDFIGLIGLIGKDAKKKIRKKS